MTPLVPLNTINDLRSLTVDYSIMSLIAQLDLLPQEGQGAARECKLGIIQADDKIIVVAIPKSGGNWTERGYILKDTRFIPRYPFSRYHPHDTSSGWRYTVVQPPQRPNSHDFANRRATLEFQKLITGYVVVGHCEDAICDATIKTVLRNRKYTGEGEIQLWSPVEHVQLAESPTGSRAGPPPSEYESYDPLSSELAKAQIIGEPSSSRPPSISLVPQRDGTRTILDRHRPPLLVAFLRDSKDRTKYTMMKVSVADLNYKRGSDLRDMLVFQNDDNSCFEVKGLDGEEANLNRSWDICGFARNTSSEIDTIKVACLKLSAKDPNNLLVFKNQFDDLKRIYATRQQEQARFRDSLNRGRAFSSTPSSPVYSRSRRKSSSALSTASSLLPRVDVTAAFESTPSIQELFGDPVTKTPRHELSQDYVVAAASFASTPPPGRPMDISSVIGLNLTTNSRTPSERLPVRGGMMMSPRRALSVATTSDTSRGRRPETHTPILSSPTPSVSSSNPTTVKTDNSNEVFEDLDSRIRRFMVSPNHATTVSVDDTINTLHCLPGGPRALLYEFDSTFSSSEGTPRRRRFRCPFDIVYPQNGLNTGCQGPGFYPLDQLWNHLSKHHSGSFDCHNCLVDFHNDDGILSHITQGCSVKSSILPRRIPFALFQPVERILTATDTSVSSPILPESEEQNLNNNDVERQDIERWNRMWDVLFPSLAGSPPSNVGTSTGTSSGKGKQTQTQTQRKRPSPFLTPPTLSHNPNLARLEMIFAAMVESDNSERTPQSFAAGQIAAFGNGTTGSAPREDMDSTKISKTQAKRYLRVAIQALFGEELDSWERVITSCEAGVDLPLALAHAGMGSSITGGVNGSGSGSGGGSGTSSNSGDDGYDVRFGPVARGFLGLMGSSPGENRGSRGGAGGG